MFTKCDLIGIILIVTESFSSALGCINVKHIPECAGVILILGVGRCCNSEKSDLPKNVNFYLTEVVHKFSR